MVAGRGPRRAGRVACDAPSVGRGPHARPSTYRQGSASIDLKAIQVSTDLLDNGDAAVLVLLDGQGRLDEDSLVLPGGGSAEVFVDEDGDTLVQVEEGKVRTHELVRAVLRSPALTVYGDVLDLVVATTTNDYDRFVLSADLDHRFLWTRQWHQREQDDAPVVTLVGHAPTRTETHGGDARADQMDALLKMAAAEVDAPAKVHVVDLFTRRVDGPSHLKCEPSERRRAPGQREEALGEADLVVAAWGPVAEDCLWAVEATVEELLEQRDRGARVVVPAADGEPATAGSPAQPALLSATATSDLVDAPAEWLHGGELG